MKRTFFIYIWFNPFDRLTFFRKSIIPKEVLFERTYKIRKIRKNKIRKKKMNFERTLFDQTTSSRIKIVSTQIETLRLPFASGSWKFSASASFTSLATII
jgi:hypothetical protein